MAVKFEELITRLLPKGKVWNYPSPNLMAIKKGLAIEFNKIYVDISDFYANFNIISTSTLADKHGKDYFLDTDLFTNRELQHIIVEYVYNEYNLKTLITDFAIFIGEPLEFFDDNNTFIGFGVMEFGNIKTGQFGDYRDLGAMSIRLRLPSTITCINYGKIKYLVDFFKPPYLQVSFDNIPTARMENFIFGTTEFAHEFGIEKDTCLNS